MKRTHGTSPAPSYHYSRPGAYLTFRAGGTFEITRWILGWGNVAEVVRPAGLRKDVVAVLKSAASLYRARGKKAPKNL